MGHLDAAWPRRAILLLLAAVGGYGAVVLAGLGEGKLGSSAERLVFDGLLVASTGLLVARAVLVPGERLAWALIALGVASWTAGEIYHSLFLAGTADDVHPSTADVFFLAFYAAAGAGLVLLAIGRLRGARTLLWIDAVIVGLATSALVAAFLDGYADAHAEITSSAYGHAIAYPVGDFILLGFVLASITIAGPRNSRAWVLIACALAATGLGDTLHVVDTDSHTSTGPYAFLWPLSTALFAAAGWTRVPRAAEAPERPSALLFMPAFSGVLALAVHVYDHFERVSLPALALATAALMAVIVRIWMAVRELARVHAEREELADRLAHAQRLRSLGHLSGGMAHEFNNLISIVRNYTYLISLSRPDDDELNADLAEITRVCEQGADLTHKLLLFSRRDIPATATVLPGPALVEMGRLLRSTVGSQVELSVDVSRCASAVAVAPGQLEQIVVNLAVNARDAMPGGGELRIALRDVTVGEDARVAAGPYAELRVQDSGSGMDQEVAERVFEPFFSTKQHGVGTGLGLSTVYGIVEQLGGTVSVFSKPGQGAVFTVLLPAQPAPATVADAGTTETRERRSAERVMLVEDDDAVRVSTRRILEGAGFDVVAFPDGERALSAWARERDDIDLVVSDVVMPYLSGPELLRRIRAHRPHVPCVLISGYRGTAGLDQPAEPLDAPLVLKPFGANQLLAAVDEALSERRGSNHWHEADLTDASAGSR
jgi:signal transduction histidine kinase/CheY-like chemotaxis protein